MFFIINHSLNLKIAGKYFQSEDISNYLGENPEFLNNLFFNDKTILEKYYPLEINEYFNVLKGYVKKYELIKLEIE
jgi:hypothetical protein